MLASGENDDAVEAVVDRRLPRRADVRQPGPPEELADPRETPVPIVGLDDDLFHQRPRIRPESLENVELRAFDVDLQEVNPRYPVFV